MTLESRPLKYIQCLIVLFILCSNKRIKGNIMLHAHIKATYIVFRAKLFPLYM